MKNTRYPFQIAKTFNKQMKCYELMVQIGGIRTKEETDDFAKAIADFLSQDNGTVKRVGFDG